MKWSLFFQLLTSIITADWRHPSPPPNFSSFLYFFPSSPDFFLTTSFPSCHTLAYFDTRAPTRRREGLALSLQCPRPQSCDVTCHVLQGCSAARGPLRKRAAFTSGRKQSKTWRGKVECMRAWVSGETVWVGDQEAVFQEMELHHKKFDMKHYVVSGKAAFEHVCLVSAWEGRYLIKEVWIFFFFFFLTSWCGFFNCYWHAWMSSGLIFSLLQPWPALLCPRIKSHASEALLSCRTSPTPASFPNEVTSTIACSLQL